MAKQVTINGNFEWITRKGKKVGTKWVDDPNGKHTIYRIEYNWVERLLIWLKLKQGKCYNGKYIIGVDPYNPERGKEKV